MTSKRNRKKQVLERAANPFGGFRMGNSSTPGNMYVIPESVLKQVIGNYAPQKDKSQMYSPGAPITPIPEITPKAGPRGWNYAAGINTSGIDRTLGNSAYDIPSFQQLRMLAKMYNGITLCERVILDMIPMLELDVVPVPGLVGDGDDASQYQADIDKFKTFFEKPDRIHDYHSWLRIAWREQTQIDELYIYKKPNRGGGLYALQIVAGDTMKPILDEQGITPMPPYPAYQQFPYGAPGGLYTSDQFIHYQESPASDTPYGFSRIERIILMVNIALRKQNKDLFRYTEGNIPAGMMEVPESVNWTPDQIDAFEQSWNALMSGNPQQQVRIKFTQPGMKYAPFDQPEAQLNLTVVDQFLLNLTAASYGLSMQDLAFTGDIHKSSGDSQQNVMYRRTLYPLIKVYAKIFTDVLRTDFNENRFQIVFRGFEESEDIGAQATAYSVLTNAGILGLSEAAKLMKLPPDPDAPYIGRVFLAKDGPVFLDDMASDEIRQAAVQAKIAGYQLAANPPDPTQQQGDDNGKDPQQQQKKAPQKAGSKDAPKSTDKATQQRSTVAASSSQEDIKEIGADYRRWRTRAIEDFRSASVRRPFVSTLIPEEIQRSIASELAECETVDDVRDVFSRAKDVSPVLPEQHWQDTNTFLQQKLTSLLAQGVETLTWRARPGSCDDCLINDGQTVRVGQRFKTGAYLTPEHDHCLCDYIDNQHRVWSWTGIDGEYKQVKSPD